MIRVEQISKAFGNRAVLKGISLNLPQAEIIGLIGPSGSGKSTLLKVIGSVLEPDSGQVTLADVDCRELALMFQEGALFDSLSVFDNVAFPLVNGQVPANLLPAETLAIVREKVAQVLCRVGLFDAAAKMPEQLSGGMRRRVSLARALVSRPKVLLLDDPTCGLDPVASSVIMELIVNLHQDYKPTTVIVSHDLRRLLPVVQRIIGVFDGRVVFDGTLDELRKLRCSDLGNFVNCRFDLKECGAIQ